MLDASGYVVARRLATVASKTIGRVTEVLIEEGQRVEQGQIVARLDDSNVRAAVEQARAQLAQAEANLDAARVALGGCEADLRPQRAADRKRASSARSSSTRRGLVTTRPARISQCARAAWSWRGPALAVAQRNLDDTVVRAPFAGVVTVKAAQAGEIVSPQSAGGGFTRTGIGTIVDMDSLEVEVDVSENFINRVRPGQPATIKLNAYPDWEIPAEVIAVIPTADRSKATVKVRVGFKEHDARVLPEMGARVSFLTRSRARRIEERRRRPLPCVIPPDAVQANGDTGTVFIINGNDTVERRVVRLGARTTDGQLVLSGLSGGARVAVGNLGALSDGAKIQSYRKKPRKERVHDDARFREERGEALHPRQAEGGSAARPGSRHRRRASSSR